jgi:hypothetical protein
MSNADPKFVPSARALQVVGLKVGEVRSSEDIITFIKTKTHEIETFDTQISVAIYILKQRGMTNEAIAKQVEYSSRTVIRKGLEGLAILRTQEVTRTVAAIRSANLSEKVVKDCTAGAGDNESKIQRLERAAVAYDIQSRFVTADGKVPDAAVIDRVMTMTANVVEANAEPATAPFLVGAIPTISEELGLKVKEVKRSGHNQGGANNPMAVEFHIKAALQDARKIAAAAEAEYTPTPADIKAVMELCEYLGLDFAVDAEFAAAIDSLA